MKIIIIGLICLTGALAETYEAISSARQINLIKKPDFPPNILARAKIDFGKSGFLKADESGQIIVHLKNSGKGKAIQFKLALEPPNIEGLAYTTNQEVGTIVPDEEKTIAIPIAAAFDVVSAKQTFKVNFTELNGFEPPPIIINFETCAFVPPVLKIADGLGIEDANGNGQIENGEVVTLTARVINKGQGRAQDVTASVKWGANVFLTPDSKYMFNLGELLPGSSKDIKFTIYTNNRATSVPVTINLTEKYGKFGNIIDLPLKFNRRIDKLQEITATGHDDGTNIGEVQGLGIDIESNIPKCKTTNPNAVALVLTIRDYSNPHIPRVEYAKRDGNLLRQYLIQALGYDPKNILPKDQEEIMTAGAIKTYVKNKLPSFLRKDGSSDLFVYYTGHGAPSTATGEAFFVPYDCDPNYVNADNAYRMDEFYADIHQLSARSKTVVIDACFSGQSADGNMLITNASPALLKLKNAVLADTQAVVFQSSTADQVSNWYPEKQHSMFTYFFLKGLQGSADLNKDGVITAAEMERFVNDQDNGMPYVSNREFQRPQNAEVKGNLGKMLLRYK